MKKARLRFLAVAACIWFGSGLTTRAVTVVSHSSDTTVYLGQPYRSLELDNPVPPERTVLGHRVLEWCDAADLGGEPTKWVQLPEPGANPNVFLGWNEISDYRKGPIAADDWVCTSANPVTRVRWWGSYSNWIASIPPGQGGAPGTFLVQFWTDVPSGPQTFSHPGTCVYATGVTAIPVFEGWDFDPIAKRYETCFRYEVDLPAGGWFYQDPGATGTNIYWVSISAASQEAEPNPWGWKTRPRNPASPAPDAAVRMTAPLQPVVGAVFASGEPLEWPRGQAWDLAFELISSHGETVVKFQQLPDLSPLGLDVQDSAGSAPELPDLLADDFLCTVSGKITHVTLWTSWKNDLVPPEGGPGSVPITLSIHGNNASPEGPYGMPGAPLWQRVFLPGSYSVRAEARELTEGWYDVNGQYLPVGDTVCWRCDFDIPPEEAFTQTGSEQEPLVYWLDAQANVSDSAYRFGWKTSAAHRIAAATWVQSAAPYLGLWGKLTYPQEHPLETENIDMAFAISMEQEVFETKWSQLPEPFTPPDGILGWDEMSVHGGSQLVADDWACQDSRPVTDVHWWGSFIGWTEQQPPRLPDSFVVTIWTDVLGAHPGEAIWQVVCTNFTYRFAGWDFDPRNPGRPPEACFLFEQDLSEREWFWQSPEAGTQLFWVSIAAGYDGQVPRQYPWGWKTRTRDVTSIAPAAAVVIADPTAPEPGVSYGEGSPLEYPIGTAWDMAFVLTTLENRLDYGDAPDPTYPTLLASDGARHTYVPGFHLGALLDWEPDGQPNASATGDDVANFADEDGVVFGTLLPGQQAQITVTASGAGMLDAWIDFGNDGSWAEAGDQICAIHPLVAGGNTISFTVPPATAAGSTIYGRFRFSTAGGLQVTGAAADGEVEDYAIVIADWPEPAADLGDAPDSSNTWGLPLNAYPPSGPPVITANYPTVYTAGSPPFGPIHNNPASTVYLGGTVTVEHDADSGPDADGRNNTLPNAGASDLDLGDDGVLFPLALPHGQSTTLSYSVWSVAAPPGMLFVNVWFDWNRNGDWNDVLHFPNGGNAPEWAVQNQKIAGVGPGPNLQITPPFIAWHPSSTVEPIWMRITLSETACPGPLGHNGAGGDGPSGGFQSGETEDYYIPDYQTGEALDLGDAPDPAYPTLLASDGARHGIVTNFLLGSAEDSEANGQPNATASGDDEAGADDDDGVLFKNQWLIGQQGCLDLTLVSGPSGGLLDAWVDFNRDGVWNNPTEAIFTSLALAPGVNSNLCFSVPWNATLGLTCARFRLSSKGGLGPTGMAQDGEVEDYQIAIRQPGNASGGLAITNMVCVPAAAVTVWWADSDAQLHYQLQSTLDLKDSAGPVWSNVGPHVIGPVNTQTDTNLPLRKFYRVTMPWTLEVRPEPQPSAQSQGAAQGTSKEKEEGIDP